MTTTYVQPTQAEFETALGPEFRLIELPGTIELVYAKRVDRDGQPLSLRVYTSLNPDGYSRECGEDAIRVAVYYRFSTLACPACDTPKGMSFGTGDCGCGIDCTKPVTDIRRIGGSKRVNRVPGWQERLQERIRNWESLLGPTCDCGAPMVERKGRNGKFWGCVTFPSCRVTKEKN